MAGGTDAVGVALGVAVCCGGWNIGVIADVLRRGGRVNAGAICGTFGFGCAASCSWITGVCAGGAIICAVGCGVTGAATGVCCVIFCVGV